MSRPIRDRPTAACFGTATPDVDAFAAIDRL
jgi:hypothetical protein